MQFARRCFVAIAISLGLVSAAPASAAEIENKFAALLVASEITEGYDRSLFPHWIDADRDGCNARYEVLIAEAITPPSVTNRCRLIGGSWRSEFDYKIFRNPSQLDVDHFVPLAEAWRSGAANWSTQQRISFANDLELPDALISVSRSTNRSKSDRDVASWLPPNRSYRCQYLSSWVEVKFKWKLTVDAAERRSLEDGLLDCGLISQRISPKLAPTTKSDTPKLQPNLIRYQNCTLARAAGVTPIRRSDNSELYQLNQHMDRDRDGVACE
ncbi:MAG: DUF1524 domain-containing protein [Actinobacteria bacterium]|uniref:Unannotated protein n=1 Tax=freshwater metagenome TaxID=449393 RepID=A0A6J6ES75_9ZZZZ|nr:DUF1524 domain-containing protein [Actinomycetota bacterium]